MYAHFNGQTFSGVFEQFSFGSKFYGLKMQKLTFFKKMVLRVVFKSWRLGGNKLVCPTWKTPNNWNFAYGRFFTHFLKMLHFSTFFEIFEIHQ